MAPFKIVKKLNKLFSSYNKQDFIPIVSYYNKDTLLTKNGDILQIITIDALQCQNAAAKIINLRKFIWESINKNIKDSNITCWIHTIRSTESIDDDDAIYSNVFASNLHKKWQQKNFWNDKFINRLYITLLYRRQEEYYSHKFKIKISPLSKKDIIFFNHLKSSVKLLTNTVSNIVKDLKEFGCKLLQIYYKEDKAYSEAISFYKYLVTLQQSEELVLKSDISSKLAVADYKVHLNNIEINFLSNTNYISFFTLKDYSNISEYCIDQFLQIPVGLIVTEVFSYERSKNIKNEIKDQSYVLDISRDEDLKNMIGISAINDDDLAMLNQTTIGVIAPNQKIMEERTKIVSQNFIEYGIAHKIEDINTESIFWSQLPGNLNYINNLSYTPKNGIARFTSLNQYPIGLRNGLWGKATTILRTIMGTPYFVNLYNSKKRSHTVIFGDSCSGKTVLTNFLLSMATKINPQILYISSNSNSSSFLNNLNIPFQEEININPFSITNYLNSDKEEFIYNILEILCNITKTDEEELAKALSQEISNSPEKYHDIIKSFYKNNSDNNFIKRLNKIIKTSDYKKYCTKDITHQDVESLAYNFKKIAKCHNEKAAIIYCLIKNFITRKIDIPKILVIDNFLQIINHEWFTKNIITILEDLNKNNGILLTNIVLRDITNLSSLIDSLINGINTKIILPSKKISIDAQNLLHLTNEEIKNLADLSDTRFFLYKQDDISVTLELSLKGLPDILSILSA